MSNPDYTVKHIDNTINDDYILGSFLGGKVLIMRKNNYVNISNLIDYSPDEIYNEAEKEKCFLPLKKSVCSDYRIEEKDLMIKIKEDSKFDGDYWHPELVLFLGMWIDIDYQIYFLENNLYNKESFKLIDQKIKELKLLSARLKDRNKDN